MCNMCASIGVSIWFRIFTFLHFYIYISIRGTRFGKCPGRLREMSGKALGKCSGRLSGNLLAGNCSGRLREMFGKALGNVLGIFPCGLQNPLRLFWLPGGGVARSRPAKFRPRAPLRASLARGAPLVQGRKGAQKGIWKGTALGPGLCPRTPGQAPGALAEISLGGLGLRRFWRCEKQFSRTHVRVASSNVPLPPEFGGIRGVFSLL
jgi:hypothetical protein